MSVCIVTGSSSGIGIETAAGLYAAGYIVVMACRDLQKARMARQQIIADVGDDVDGRLIIMCLDLASFESVVTFTSDFKLRFRSLHILVNNAGLNLTDDQQYTIDGHYQLFQVNFLSHVLLSELLWSLLESSKGRVINVASVMHRVADNHFSAASRARYSTSKLAQVMYSYWCQRRPESVVTSIAVNPGPVNSDIWRYLPLSIRWIAQTVFRIAFLNVKQGAAASLSAAFMKLPDGRRRDLYYVNSMETYCGMPEWTGDYWGPFAHKVIRPSSPASYNVDAAQALMQLTFDLLKPHLK